MMKIVIEWCIKTGKSFLGWDFAGIASEAGKIVHSMYV